MYGLTMKPEAKRQWIEDLTSGKFIQGQDNLKKVLSSTEGKAAYCCLGVFSESQKVEQRISSFGGVTFVFPDGKEDSSLPSVIWFGNFFDFKPSKKFPRKEMAISKLMDQLASRNDGSGDRAGSKLWSFNRIADWIRKNL